MSAIPRAMVQQVLERDNGLCLLALPGCQVDAGCADHRANRQSGGSKLLNNPMNLIGACGLCNSAKADAHAIVLMDLEERGLYVRPDSTHAKTLRRAQMTPVEYLDGSLFFLTAWYTREPADIEPEW